MSGWGWLMGLWIVFGIAVLVLLVLAAVWLARNLGSQQSQGIAGQLDRPGVGSAREALDLRYARGEIIREDYLQARQDLEGSGG